MEVDKIDGKPVIIKVAICHSKGFEEKVYREIASDTATERKKALYGK